MTQYYPVAFRIDAVTLGSRWRMFRRNVYNELPDVPFAH